MRLAEVFLIALIVTPATFADTPQIIKLYLTYNGTDVYSSGIEFAAGFPYDDPGQPSDEFRAELIASDGSLIHGTNLSMSLDVFDGPPLKEREAIIRLPYDASASRIDVYEKGALILSVPISGLVASVEARQKAEPIQAELYVTGRWSESLIVLLLIAVLAIAVFATTRSKKGL